MADPEHKFGRLFTPNRRLRGGQPLTTHQSRIFLECEMYEMCVGEKRIEKMSEIRDTTEDLLDMFGTIKTEEDWNAAVEKAKDLCQLSKKIVS